MEGLCQNWGFYFVASPDTNSIGISDVKDALASFRDYTAWTEVLPTQLEYPRERASCQGTNEAIARKAFMKVLAARVVVFEEFLELAVRIDGHIHKHAWLMFQMS